MTAIADATRSTPSPAPARLSLDQPVNIRFLLGFMGVLAAGLLFMAYSIYSDISDADRKSVV